jgi:sulfoxide reductase heme-binding subunit YedZ
MAPAPSIAARLAIPKIPPWIIYAVGFQPAIWTFYSALTDQLGADPMRTLEQTLGLWALRFLIAALLVTPLRVSLGLNLLRYRRQLGLLGFYYAVLHLSTYLILDQQLDGASIIADILKRPYITIGMAAFTLLVPLAVTSNNASIRRLGAKAWARLHKLAYVATALAAAHFVMVVKSWPPEPLIYAAIVAALLGYRVFMAWRPGGRRMPHVSPGRAKPALSTVDHRQAQ